jgi:hypothetical protein
VASNLFLILRWWRITGSLYSISGGRPLFPYSGGEGEPIYFPDSVGKVGKRQDAGLASSSRLKKYPIPSSLGPTASSRIQPSLLYRYRYSSPYCTDTDTALLTVQIQIQLSLLYRYRYSSPYCTDTDTHPNSHICTIHTYRYPHPYTKK